MAKCRCFMSGRCNFGVEWDSSATPTFAAQAEEIQAQLLLLKMPLPWVLTAYKRSVAHHGLPVAPSSCPVACEDMRIAIAASGTNRFLFQTWRNYSIAFKIQLLPVNSLSIAKAPSALLLLPSRSRDSSISKHPRLLRSPHSLRRSDKLQVGHKWWHPFNDH
jgi:hypothetical protein